MLLDNVLRPLVMARGLSTPMPVILIGVIGGALAHGLIGLFIGPIVLSIAWQLLVAWMRRGDRRGRQAGLASRREAACLAAANFIYLGSAKLTVPFPGNSLKIALWRLSTFARALLS